MVGRVNVSCWLCEDLVYLCCCDVSVNRRRLSCSLPCLPCHSRSLSIDKTTMTDIIKPAIPRATRPSTAHSSNASPIIRREPSPQHAFPASRQNDRRTFPRPPLALQVVFSPSLPIALSRPSLTARSTFCWCACWQGLFDWWECMGARSGDASSRCGFLVGLLFRSLL